MEGARQIARNIEHYHLAAILAVGFRGRSHRGSIFTRPAWTTCPTQRLANNYLSEDDLQVPTSALPEPPNTKEATA